MRNIHLLNVPEGNRNGSGRTRSGQAFVLMNRLKAGDTPSDRASDRKSHRGWELSGKTVGIIGYGNTGKSFAQRISSFEVETLCYDILDNVGDQFARQVSWEKLQSQCEVISLNIPQTRQTRGMIDKKFIADMTHPFWLLNTSLGSALVTDDLVAGLKSK